MLRKSAARRFRRSSPRPAGNPAEVRAAAFRRTVRARRTQRASRQFRHRSGRKRLKKCHSTTPAATDTLIECFVPACGISMAPSHRSTTA